MAQNNLNDMKVKRSTNSWKITSIICITLLVILITLSTILLLLSLFRETSSNDKNHQLDDAIADSAKAGYKTIDVTRATDTSKKLYLTFPDDWNAKYDDGFSLFYKDTFAYSNTSLWHDAMTVSVIYNVNLLSELGGTCDSESPLGGKIVAIKLTKTNYEKFDLLEAAIKYPEQNDHNERFYSSLVKAGQYDDVKVGYSGCELFYAQLMQNDWKTDNANSGVTEAGIDILSSDTLTTEQAVYIVNDEKNDDAFEKQIVERYRAARQVLLSISDKRN